MNTIQSLITIWISNWTLINEVSFALEESIQSTESVDSTKGTEAYYETQGTENIDSTEES